MGQLDTFFILGRLKKNLNLFDSALPNILY
jgi:hypothetical protein